MFLVGSVLTINLVSNISIAQLVGLIIHSRVYLLSNISGSNGFGLRILECPIDSEDVRNPHTREPGKELHKPTWDCSNPMIWYKIRSLPLFDNFDGITVSSWLNDTHTHTISPTLYIAKLIKQFDPLLDCKTMTLMFPRCSECMHYLPRWRMATFKGS